MREPERSPEQLEQRRIRLNDEELGQFYALRYINGRVDISEMITQVISFEDTRLAETDEGLDSYILTYEAKERETSPVDFTINTLQLKSLQRVAVAYSMHQSSVIRALLIKTLRDHIINGEPQAKERAEEWCRSITAYRESSSGDD